MPASHTIRLREPWQSERTSSGGVRFRRRFGWAAPLTGDERVNLVISDVTTRGQVWVNGADLGPLDPASLPAQFSIAGLLQPRNEVVIEVAGGNLGDVRLEIHETD